MMNPRKSIAPFFSMGRLFTRCLLGVLACACLMSVADAQDELKQVVGQFEEALDSVDGNSSEARQRLAVRRVIRDAEKALDECGDKPDRWKVLEFLFRARQRLVSLDDDEKHREDLVEVCRELIKAPDEFAEYRLEADLLLSQAEQVKKGADAGSRASALRPFVKRYLDTPAGAKALRVAMVMALELGDTRLVNDLREMIAERFAGDLEMITFQRDKLGGQVFGVPVVGHFKRSDGKTARFPMDVLGHSSMLVFWSIKDEGAVQYLADLAAASKKGRDQIDGLLEIISVNLDDLPDAGESIIRGMGVDWQVLHLPGGRENPVYDAYVRADPLNLRVAPTGQAAMVMRESNREPEPDKPAVNPKQITPAEDLEPYFETFRRTLIRSWSRQDYAMNVSALVTGDFLIFDPERGLPADLSSLDPLRPPELKAAAMGGEVKPLERGPESVPEETLIAIQDCLIAPPERYHAEVSEVRESYRKMVELCRQAIADHPEASDLWIVRNRLIIALFGLWKTDFDLVHFEAAVVEAEAALEAGYPDGTELIARFCLARQALRDPEVDGKKLIAGFVADQGGANASGSVLAVAALLSLDIADEAGFNNYREAILKDHTEYPMMWVFSGFLLDRYHDYWLFQVPFTAGWSFGRRLKYEMVKGDAEDARRMLEVELPTVEGKDFRIPQDLKADYTVIFFAQPGPWRGNDREDQRPPSPGRMMGRFPSFVMSRPDVDMMIAMLGDCDAAAVRESLNIKQSEEQTEPRILKVPGGMNHPIVQRLGLLSAKEGAVIMNKDGRILRVISGIGFSDVAQSLENTVMREDERVVVDALERGDVEFARKRIMELAPPYDPDAVDEKGRKLKEPKFSLAHLRARARVYMALEQWDKALQDAEAVLQSQLGAAGGMSLRTDELDEAEALRDTILEQRDKAKQ